MYYKQKGSKYGNKKVRIGNITFDSRKEARRYEELKLMEKIGLISNLVLQPRFTLQEKFIYNGTTYRKIDYIADFSYTRTEDDILVIEDVKGLKTDVFKLKEKMFLKIMLEKGQNFEFNLI